MNDLSSVVRYKINTQKSVAFLYTSKEQFENEISSLRQSSLTSEESCVPPAASTAPPNTKHTRLSLSPVLTSSGPAQRGHPGSPKGGAECRPRWALGTAVVWKPQAAGTEAPLRFRLAREWGQGRLLWGQSPPLLVPHLGEVAGTVGWPTSPLPFSSMARQAQACEGLPFPRPPPLRGHDAGPRWPLTDPERGGWLWWDQAVLCLRLPRDWPNFGDRCRHPQPLSPEDGPPKGSPS